MSSSVPPMVSPRSISTCLCLPNLNMAVFDDHADQVPALQENLLIMWAERAEDLGFNVEGLEVETQDGKLVLQKSKREGGWFVDYSPKFRINIKKL